MKPDYERNYRKSAKKEKTERTIKISIYAEFILVLLLYLRIFFENQYFTTKLNCLKMPELIKFWLGDLLVCFKHIHFTD